MADRPAAPASATGSRKPEGGGTKTLNSVNIEPSKNGGYTVEQRYRMKKKESGPSCYDGYCEPDTYTFESLDSLFAHLKKTL